MIRPSRGALWDAINRYTQACGGDPSKQVYGNAPRQNAVAEVESVVRGLEETAAGLPPQDGTERALAQAGLLLVRLACKALAPFDERAGDPARRGRGVRAELRELEARLEVLVADLGGRLR